MSLRFILILVMLVSHAIGRKSTARYTNPPAKPISDYYRYGYEVSDAENQSEFSHSETSQSGETKGEYRTFLPDGRWQIVSYIADDEEGYRAFVRYDDPIQPIPNEPAATRRGKSRKWKNRHLSEKEKPDEKYRESRDPVGAASSIEEIYWEMPQRESIRPVGVGSDEESSDEVTSWKTLQRVPVKAMAAKKKPGKSRTRYVETKDWETRHPSRGQSIGQQTSWKAPQREPLAIRGKKAKNNVRYIETNQWQTRGNPAKESYEEESIDPIAVEEEDEEEEEEEETRSSVRYIESNELKSRNPFETESSSEEEEEEEEESNWEITQSRNPSKKKSLYKASGPVSSHQVDTAVIHPPPTVWRKPPVAILQDDHQQFEADDQETSSEEGRSPVNLVAQQSPQLAQEIRSPSRFSKGGSYGKRTKPLSRIVTEEIHDGYTAVVEDVALQRPAKSPTRNQAANKTKNPKSTVKIRKIKLSKFQVEDPPAKFQRRLKFPPNVRLLENSERVARQIASPQTSL